MTKHKIVNLVVTACLAFSGPVFARPVCNIPQEKWIKEEDIKLSLWKLGYTIKTFAVSNGCYAIRVVDHSGQQLVLFLDPSTGEPVDE